MRVFVALLLVLIVVAVYLGWLTFSAQRHTPDDGKVNIGVEVDTNKIRSDTEAARDRASEIGKTVREKVPGTKP